MQILLSAQRKKGGCKIRLLQHFSARQRNSAAGMLIKRPIQQCNFQKLFFCIRCSDNFQCLCRTLFQTLPAKLTMFKINLMPKLFCPGFRQPMYITVTCRFTAPASNALLTMKRQLLSGILTLRIMAPPTAQRAALKKECRPHTWSVMQASPLNIYKQRFQTISSLSGITALRSDTGHILFSDTAQQ